MDDALQEIINKAANRGHRYMKGDIPLEDLHEKIAELGVCLLEKAKIMRKAQPEVLRSELIDIQNMIDDIRKVLFAKKLEIK